MKKIYTVKTVSAVLLFILLMTCNSVSIAKATQCTSPETGKQKVSWTPPPPPPDKFDWIQLNSGEWLKGEFKLLYDDEIEFDSDELDLLNLDWEDVKQVRGHANHSVHFEGQEEDVIVGNLQVIGDRVLIVSGKESHEFNRADIVSIVHGSPKESNYWSGDFSLGVNIKEGNTEQQDLNLSLTVKRLTANSRFITNYMGFYSESDSTKTDENHRLGSTLDIFETRKFFWRPLFAEYYRDPFQNISSQLTVGAGAGYQLIDTLKIEWSIAAGPAFKYTKFKDIEADESDTESTGALWFETNYEHELNSKIDLILGYQTITGNQDSGGYTHHAVATLETELLSWLDLDTSFIWDRIQRPAPNSDGSVPDKDDYRFVIGLGVEF